MDDPTSLIQVTQVLLRNDGVIQIEYAEPAQQSNQVTRMQVICFEADLLPKHLLNWLEHTQEMVYAAIFAQNEEDKPAPRPR